MEKRISMLILLLSIFILPTTAKALDREEYINQNGVSINVDIYDKLIDTYSTSYVETLTNDEYQNIISNDLENIIVVEYEDFGNVLTRGSSYSTSNKTVKLIKNGNYVTIIATWKTVPKIKSYDVIAVRFDGGVSLNGTAIFKQTYVADGKTVLSYDSYIQTFSNGVGSSFKVGTGTGYEFSLNFPITGNGTVYGSYQHASSTASLADSKKYSLSYLGLGGVIYFQSSVRDKYDAMSGVSLSV